MAEERARHDVRCPVRIAVDHPEADEQRERIADERNPDLIRIVRGKRRGDGYRRGGVPGGPGGKRPYALEGTKLMGVFWMIEAIGGVGVATMQRIGAADGDLQDAGCDDRHRKGLQRGTPRARRRRVVQTEADKVDGRGDGRRQNVAGIERAVRVGRGHQIALHGHADALVSAAERHDPRRQDCAAVKEKVVSGERIDEVHAQAIDGGGHRRGCRGGRRDHGRGAMCKAAAAQDRNPDHRCSPSCKLGLGHDHTIARSAFRHFRRLFVSVREGGLAVPLPSHLNAAQREAVEHGDGPLLVLAGAGSGKTRVVTHRIVRLVERAVPPQAIVALTFTNKAAAEMRQRVAKMLGAGGAAAARSLTMCTFHSFGLGVLRRERQAVGGAFTIFDQGDQTSLVKQLLRLAGADRAYDAQAVIARISNAKNAFLTPGQLPQRDEYDEIAGVIFPRYQAALRQYRAYDFDDLVCEVARLWQDSAEVRARWQERFLHVLVDEYQDTNRAQLEMLRLLCGDRRNICAVGDDDQAIYGWRGADVRNILEFEQHFAQARVVKLEHNYRSCKPILAVANAIIAKRVNAKWPKVLFTDRTGGDKVRLAVASTPESEAAWVGRQVRRLVRDEGKRPGEVAILYRSNGQSRLLEETLREQGIAHRVLGGVQFFERKEVKDVLAYVKLALNPADEISLRRIVNYPARAIGEATLEKLALHAAKRQWTLWQAIERADALDDVPGAALGGCRSLVEVVAGMRRALFGEKQVPSDVVRGLCEQVGLKREIDESAPSPDTAAKRWANVEWLFGTLARRESRGGSGTDGLSSYLHSLTMGVEAEGEDAADVVTLSTLHGSKGLEFEAVFLVGCEEGYLPHARTLDARATDTIEGGGDIEEERRLMYVGVTRAREQLVLSRAKARVLRGKGIARTPSRFLMDVEPELFDEVEITDDAPTTAREAAANAGAILAMLR